MKPKSFFLKILSLFLVLGTLYQLQDDYSFFIEKFTQKVWPNRGLDAISRSADTAYGSEFLDYVTFMWQTIPETATVYDTRTFNLPQYDLYTFVSYFLIPRKVIPITDEICGGGVDLDYCLLQVASQSTYAIYGAGYSPPSTILESYSILPFANGLGILAPRK